VITIYIGGINVAQISQIGSGIVDIREGWYSPEFGINHTCPVITAVVADVNLPHKAGWIIESYDWA